MDPDEQLNYWHLVTTKYPLEDYEANPWISEIDASGIYGIVKHFEPKVIIEIGAGVSTKYLLAGLRRGASIISIDPYTGRIPDSPRVSILPKKLEDIHLSLFNILEKGDILFIDSSHKWEPGNDVDIEYYSILPSLQSGVVVHIHDIFIPDTYPAEWGLRRYNEQEHVEALLAAGGWKVLFSTYFLKKSFPDLFPESSGAGSLWIVKE